ncbi:MAG: 4'-phosphopantetheinyl transferase family protein [Hyphomicrobiaceae bacterium]
MSPGLSLWWIPRAFLECDILGQLEDKYLIPAERNDTLSDPMRRATRVALRTILSVTRGESWGSERFATTSDGRPFIDRAMAPVFSVSHTLTAGLVAVADDGPLGVDIERMRATKLGQSRIQSIIRAATHHGIWDGASSTSESSCLELEVEGEVEADRMFLVVWTRLEAIAKARGGGIGALLEDIGARPGAEHLIHVGPRVRPLNSVLPSGCSMRPLALPSGHVGAVVARMGPSPPPLRWFPTSLTALDEFCQSGLGRCE